MIALTIISILATLAIYGYATFAKKAKASEAVDYIGAIRIMLVSYRAINDTYLTLDKHPEGDVPSSPQQWGEPVGNWVELGFSITASTSKVRYQYEVEVGSTEDIASSFKITAQTDFDGKGEPYDTWIQDSDGSLAHTDVYK